MDGDHQVIPSSKSHPLTDVGWGPIRWADVLKPDEWRVPLYHADINYTVYVGNGMVRHYTNKTLPDPLKSKMAMILGYWRNHPELVRELTLDNLVGFGFATGMCFYRNTYPAEFCDIGWRISESYYTVIIDDKLLSTMRGQHDTRREGEEKSS